MCSVPRPPHPLSRVRRSPDAPPSNYTQEIEIVKRTYTTRLLWFLSSVYRFIELFYFLFYLFFYIPYLLRINLSVVKYYSPPPDGPLLD